MKYQAAKTTVFTILSSFAVCAFAETNVWQGANTTSGNATETDIDDPNLWSLGHVPTAGDTAKIAYSAAHSIDLYIHSSSSFAPDLLLFRSATDWNAGAQYQRLYLDKSLSLERLKLETYGASGGGSGWHFEHRLQVGTQTSDPVTITLTGNGDALDLTTNNGNWGLLNFGSQGNVVLDFAGSDIAFSKGQQRWHSYPVLREGVAKDNATLTANSTVQFSTSGAKVNLEDQGIRGPSIAPGNCYFKVRSDQVWTAAANAYVSLNMHSAANTSSQPRALVESIDGGRLDNLGQINILVLPNGVEMSDTGVDAQPILGGTYGSLYLRGGNTSFRNRCLGLSGNVTLDSACVTPPTVSLPASATEYSLILETSNQAGSYWHLFLNGYELTLSKGLLLADTSGGNNCNKLIHAQNATLAIGGDFTIDSVVASATNAAPNRSYGIRADAGTVLNLGGSFISNCRCLYLAPNSVNNRNNLNFSESTVNLVGGADKLVTYEVGDASTTTGIQRNTFSISNLCVGVSAKSSHARLVNDFLNENDASAWQEGEDKNDYRVGEKLIVHELSIGPGSTLEVAGQNVEVGRSLAVDATGKLDLASGERIYGKTTRMNFYGLGDQSEAWNALAERVVDSSNPNTVFHAVYVPSTDRTYWNSSSLGLAVFLR